MVIYDDLMVTFGGWMNINNVFLNVNGDLMLV